MPAEMSFDIDSDGQRTSSQATANSNKAQANTTKVEDNARTESTVDLQLDLDTTIVRELTIE